MFEPYISNGFISWGDPFKSVFANGTNLIQKALSERSGYGKLTITQSAFFYNLSFINSQIISKPKFKMETIQEVRNFTLILLLLN